MKIPKHIEKLIEKRARLAEELNSVDYELSNWLEDNDIQIGRDYYRGGIEIYSDPQGSASKVRRAIYDKWVSRVE